MARTAEQVGTPQSANWPPPGKYQVTVIGADRWFSPKKKTPAAHLTLSTPDRAYEFDDMIFVTEKAIQRLNLVAQRVCEMPKETPLPDDDLECAKFLGRYILEHAIGRQCIVTVETSIEEFIYESGDKIGQKGSRTKHHVAFTGYERLEPGMPANPPAMPAQRNLTQPPPTTYTAPGQPTAADDALPADVPSGDEIPF
jgi:hypothetical protein